MYQFYYAKDRGADCPRPTYKENVYEKIEIKSIMPTMWEEHCLECSAPVCYSECQIYKRRIDGRCQRFENSIAKESNVLGCCGESVRLKFRQWSNMMTIVFPSMISMEEYQTLTKKNERLGNHLRKVAYSKLPTQCKWQYIRGREYLRRRKLRKANQPFNKPDTFIFHGYNFEPQAFRLIIELHDEHLSIGRISLQLQQGENLFILNRSQWFQKELQGNYLIKVYPENNLEADLDILWCDFVQAEYIEKKEHAEKVKCLVWDLDNTLWDGVLIEKENPRDLRLRPNVLKVIQELDSRGIVQSIASKNDFAVAWDIIKHLGVEEYFIYPQIHWNAKSVSIKEIAENLNIGIDALALIDDSIFERKQVQSVYPQVRAYDENMVEHILGLSEFSVIVTEESKNRRKMYQAEEKRKLFKKSENTDTIDFIRKCHLTMSLFIPESKEELQRCYELVVRTNQLNLSGVKYTQAEFENIIRRDGHYNFAFSCKDDFGEYGIVGFGQYRIDDNILIFTEFAMSCRVAGKYVKSALFASLLAKHTCKTGRFEIVKTKKNDLLVRTLKDIGFIIDFENDKKIRFVFNSELKEKALVQVH